MVFPRRWDLCTQHSTQHLVTALTSAKWGIETLSWNLGETTSFLELATPDFTLQQLDELEKMSNDAIRAGKKVSMYRFDISMTIWMTIWI